MTQQQPGQWLASRLIGTTVVSANNESIGDVNDVLMDRGGQSVAVVVGVGGFLGIGEKDVAVPFGSLEFMSRAVASASGTASTGAGAGSTSTTSGSTGTSGSSTAPAGTASTSATSSSRDASPDRIMLRMSKQDLQNAPRFARVGESASATSTSSTTAPGASTGTGTAPRQ